MKQTKKQEKMYEGALCNFQDEGYMDKPLYNVGIALDQNGFKVNAVIKEVTVGELKSIMEGLTDSTKGKPKIFG